MCRFSIREDNKNWANMQSGHFLDNNMTIDWFADEPMTCWGRLKDNGLQMSAAPCPCVPDKGESASGLERNPDQVHSSHTQLSPPPPPTPYPSPPSSCDARALTGVKRKTQCCQNKKRQRAWGHRRTKDTSGIGLRPLTKCHLWILFTIASSRKSCRCKHVRATLLVIFPGREYDLIELRNWKSLWDKVTTLKISHKNIARLMMDYSRYKIRFGF